MLDAKTKRFVRDQTEGMDLNHATKRVQKLIRCPRGHARLMVKEARYKVFVECQPNGLWRVYVWLGHKEFKTKHEAEAWMDEQENL